MNDETVRGGMAEWYPVYPTGSLSGGSWQRTSPLPRATGKISTCCSWPGHKLHDLAGKEIGWAKRSPKID